MSLVWLALGLAAACERPGGQCSDPIIGRDRVGVVRIGLPIDSLRSMCPFVRDTSEMNEGESVRVVYALVANDTLKVEVISGKIWRIYVYRPTYVTTDSVRVGMLLSRFMVGRNPGNFGMGEGKAYFLDPGHPGLSFGLSAEAYGPPRPRAPPGLRGLPASTVIDLILVVP